MRLIDSHCHLDHPRFDTDREEVLSRARVAGLQVQVIPATTRDGWQKISALCRHTPDLYPAYGLHPMFHSAHRDDDIDELERWLKSEKAVAIGECGLDFFIENPDRKRQTALFEGQLELATRFHLPVIIHARKAVEEVIASLRNFPGVRGVLHSYSGSYQQAQQLINMGFLFGFGGPVTYSRSNRLRKLVKQLPLDVLLLESDAPDQPDACHHGERNEPAYLTSVLKTIAELRGISPETLAAATSGNAEELFGTLSTDA